MEQAITLAKQSDSTILILLVVVAIIVLAFIPVMKTMATIRRNERSQEYERENRLIQVIERNTEVNSALKTVIENDQKACVDCKNEQLSLFRKVFDNQEIANMKLTEIQAKM